MTAGERIGLLVPSSNTVMEVDFNRRLPERFTVHTARMYLENTTPKDEGIMLDEHVMPAVRDVATARPSAVVFGCTSAGALRGDEYDRDLCRRIGRIAGAPAISVIASVREAIDRRGARRVGVVTPYTDALNEPIRQGLESGGVRVSAIRGLGITENYEIATFEPSAIAAFAVESLAGSEMDAVFASCTNFRAVDAIEEIERALGVPAVTSNLAALEAVLLRFDLDPSTALARPRFADDDGT